MGIFSHDFLMNYFLYVMRKLKSFKTKVKLILGRKGDIMEHGSIFFFKKGIVRNFKIGKNTHITLVFIL